MNSWVEADNFVAVSERLDCASEEFGRTADHILWFKTGIHVYDTSSTSARQLLSHRDTVWFDRAVR